MKLMTKVNKCIFHGKFKHISRFSIIGVANTGIDFLMFTVFNELVGAGYMISQIVGYSFGIINSFIFNKKWTFKERKINKKVLYELMQFIVVNLGSLIITVFVMNFLAKNLNINVYLAKVIVTIIAQATNFVAYKFIVFK
ncbi:GtrA family protein [Clostridium botulinum]|uniref:GtrA family protein n=1 Tax=Clostridium botulinum TaxID=1491 RepID=UPI000D122336|nr:GtrA family protein [Clostridium botulinum]AVQ45733.1 GtrA family protein [Clostridium botulinum]AVQ48371.1 GtrA family protein [Clostridium botulinum]